MGYCQERIVFVCFGSRVIRASGSTFSEEKVEGGTGTGYPSKGSSAICAVNRRT